MKRWIVAALFGVGGYLTSVAPVAAQILDPNFPDMPHDALGVHTLVLGGDYAFAFYVTNECEWEQTVHFTARGQSLRVASIPGKDFRGFKILLKGPMGANQDGADFESFRLTASHDAIRRGDTLCQRAESTVTVRLRWVTPAAAGRTPMRGTVERTNSDRERASLLISPLTDAPKSVATPAPADPVSPPPAQPEPASTTGLELPDLAIPGANPSPPVTPEEAFGSGPPVLTPKKPDPPKPEPPKPTPPKPVPTPSRPLGPSTPIETGGKASLNLHGNYSASIVIKNTCDWEQEVSIESNERNFETRHRSIPAQGSAVVEININPEGGAGGDVFRLDVEHEPDVQGDKTCQQEAASFSLDINWVDIETTVIPQGVADAGVLTLRQTIRAGEPVVPEVPKTAKPVGTIEYGIPTTPGFGEPGCSELNDCIPLDGCGAGPCTEIPTPPTGGDGLFQELGAETVRVRIEITPQQAAVPQRSPMNPLGLLSRSMSEFMNWWMPTLEAAEQNLQKGLQFLITSQGGSTGKNLTMQVLNFTGKPVNLQGMIALEPLKKDAQQKVTQAFSKLAGRQLPTKVDLNAYCLEFLKLPPIAGQVMRVAGPEVQKRFAPLKNIMAAANRLNSSGALKPDSNPASYADSIKQWALWTVEQKFNDKKFGEAFLTHTKKNVEAAGQKWTRQIEDVVRQRTPNRWQDIVQILKTAGAAVPQ